MSLLSGATLTMAHADRTRLQVFIPTATATALGIAAESLGLSKTQTVETILGQYLTRQGMLTTNTAAWPKPKPPASVQRPITLPTRLVEWLRCQPGNISDATRSAIASGIRIEQQGGKPYRPPKKWMQHRSRVNVRIPAKMANVIKARQAQKDLSWSEVALTYILGAYVEAYNASKSP